MSRAPLLSLLPLLLLIVPPAFAQGSSAIDDAWGDPEPPPTETAPSVAPAPARREAVEAIEDAWAEDAPPVAAEPTPASKQTPPAAAAPVPKQTPPATSAAPAPQSERATEPVSARTPRTPAAAAIEDAWADDAPPPEDVAPGRSSTPVAKPVAPAPARAGRSASAQPARRQAKAPEVEPALDEGGDAAPLPGAVALASTRRIRDADFARAFQTWREALTEGSPVEAEAALTALLALKEEAGAGSLEVLGVAALRLAEARLARGESLQAVAVTQGALALAPEVPSVHFGAARLFFRADASNPGRGVSAALGGVRALWGSAGATRGWVNVGTVVLLALVGTALLGVALLFLRGARRFFHDFHHLFPSVAAHWQSATLAVLLLSLPVVLRWGLLPSLIVVALAVSMSLAFKERLVAAALLALLGLVPLGAGALVESAAFLGTPAADAARLINGGSTAESAAARVEQRRTEGRADATELLALGTFQGRRGALGRAEAILREAGKLAPGDARILTALGNVRFGRGDAEGALKLYQDAANASASLAAPHLNLSSLHERRATRLDVAEALRERNRAQQARAQAEQLDPSLRARTQPSHPILNLLVRWPSPEPSAVLALADGHGVGGRIGQQAAALVGGRADPLRSAAVGVLGALLVLGFGALRGPLKASTPCAKCGGEACRRCDPGLVLAKGLCSQCSNAFGKRGVVPPQQRARKQVEIQRQKDRRHRFASSLGLLVSGAGHLVSGAPLVGILAIFSFLVGLVGVVLYRGVLRPVHGPVDAAMLSLLPLLPVLLLLHLWTVRSLRRRLSEEG